MSSPPPVRVGIGVEIQGDLLGPARIAGTKAALGRAALAAATYVRGTWMALARRVGTGDSYVNGIQTDDVQFSESGDHLTVRVTIVNTAPGAKWVEQGHGAYHLPSRIDWSRTDGKIKRNPRTGARWLTIPIRHRAYATPAQANQQGLSEATRAAMMPRTVYQAAKQLTASFKHNQGPVHAADGRYLAADRYTWGRRLSVAQLVPLVGREAASRYRGMVRFEQLQAGGGRSSVYLTFRTLTPKSRGWHIPARPGKHLARRVGEHVASGEGRAYLQELLREAVRGAMGG